jgi:hypothetical protein
MQSLSCHVQYLCRITHSLNFFLRTQHGQILISLKVLRATDSQVYPSDYKVFPSLWTWTHRTRTPSRYDSTATSKKLGLKSGWILDVNPERRLWRIGRSEWEAFMEGVWDCAPCIPEWCFGCRNDTKAGRPGYWQTYWHSIPSDFFHITRRWLDQHYNARVRAPSMQPRGRRTLACLEEEVSHVLLTLQYTPAGHVCSTSSLTSYTSYSIGNGHAACKLC